MSHPIILDFTKKRVIQEGDAGYEAELARLRVMQAQQTMIATNAIPPEGWRPACS